MDFKIMVVGEGGVGKSTLHVKFTTGNFVTEHDPTIEERYRPQRQVDDEAAVIEIIDNAGQEEFVQLRDAQMRHCHGFLLCFALNKHQTFEEVGRWLDQIRAAKADDGSPCVVLVGTKHDLESDREVNTAEIEEYAKERGLPWVETSAKTNRNVEEAFAMVIRLVREKRNPKVEEKPRHIKPCVIQ